MSIVFTHQNGWILSHENYINEIYKNVRCHAIVSSFKLKSAFFNINSPFLRQNQWRMLNKNEEDTNNLVSSKRKKRKKAISFTNDLVEQVSKLI